MYIPAYARNDNLADLLALMQQHPFATLITAPEGQPFATHLPMLVRQEGEQVVLLSHLARANPQWRHFGSGEALAIFHGPHALVDPSMYDSRSNVPTWNYAVLHAYGEARVVEGEHERAIAYGLVEQHTPDMSPLPDDLERRLLAAVVTFELRVTRLEGKFKLSQNKSAQDRANVIETLSRSERDHERATAQLMRQLEVRTLG